MSSQKVERHQHIMGNASVRPCGQRELTFNPFLKLTPRWVTLSHGRILVFWITILMKWALMFSPQENSLHLWCFEASCLGVGWPSWLMCFPTWANEIRVQILYLGAFFNSALIPIIHFFTLLSILFRSPPFQWSWKAFVFLFAWGWSGPVVLAQ